MNKFVLVLVMLGLCFAGRAVAMPNPWEETTLADAMAQLGTSVTLAPPTGYKAEYVAKGNSDMVKSGKIAPALKVIYKKSGSGDVWVQMMKEHDTWRAAQKTATKIDGAKLLAVIDENRRVTYATGPVTVLVDSDSNEQSRSLVGIVQCSEE